MASDRVEAVSEPWFAESLWRRRCPCTTPRQPTSSSSSGCHKATGRDLPQWFETLDNGPGLLRFDERVNWLRDEHNISHGHASAIVHEHDLLRGARRVT